MNGLNDKQIKAIGLISIGLTDGEVAKEVGVTRETINTWKNSNYEFMAELNKYRNSVLDNIRDRQTQLLTKAFDVLDKHLSNQLELDSQEMDINTAISVLKLIKLTGGNLETNAEIIKCKNISRERLEKAFL